MTKFHRVIVVADEPRIRGKVANLLARNKIIEWDLPDPFGRGRQAYRNCAEAIKRHLADLPKGLQIDPKAADETSRRLGCSAKPAQAGNTVESLASVRKYVCHALKRLGTEGLAGSHLLGVATKAIGLFEGFQHKLLTDLLTAREIEYEKTLKQKVKGKPLKNLTLGEVIRCFRELGEQQDARLDEINRLRIDLLHRQAEIAINETTRRAKAEQVLRLISEVVYTYGFHLLGVNAKGRAGTGRHEGGGSNERQK